MPDWGQQSILWAWSMGGFENGYADHGTLHKVGFAAGNKKGAHWRLSPIPLS